MHFLAAFRGWNSTDTAMVQGHNKNGDDDAQAIALIFDGRQIEFSRIVLSIVFI
jgi:hypothetical protein